MVSSGRAGERVSTTGMKLLLVVLFVIWSNSFTAIGYLRDVLSPTELVLARYLPVALFCAVFLAAVKSKREESLAIIREAPVRLVAMGLTGIAGYNYFLCVGQSEVKPGAAALLTTLSPLFTLILAIIFLRERVPLRRALGIVVALAGLTVVVRLGRVGLGRVTGITHSDVHYVLITALAPLCWAIYTIIGKNVLDRASPLTVTFLTVIVGTLPFLSVARGHFFSTVLAFTPIHWMALAYLGVLCTLVGFWIWFAALKRMSATSVASFVYLNPPFAALFGSVLFGEIITRFFILGGAIMLSGLYLAQSGRDPDSVKTSRVR